MDVIFNDRQPCLFPGILKSYSNETKTLHHVLRKILQRILGPARHFENGEGPGDEVETSIIQGPHQYELPN